MESITARFQWTAEDLATGRKDFLRANPGRRLFLYSLSGLGASYLLWSLFRRGATAPSWIVLGILLFAVAATLFLTNKWILPYLRKREFAKRPDANREIEGTFTDGSVKIASASGKSESPWHSFYRIISTPAELLFSTTPKSSCSSPNAPSPLKRISKPAKRLPGNMPGISRN